jgi:hypothetical protein
VLNAVKVFDCVADDLLENNAWGEILTPEEKYGILWNLMAELGVGPKESVWQDHWILKLMQDEVERGVRLKRELDYGRDWKTIVSEKVTHSEDTLAAMDKEREEIVGAQIGAECMPTYDGAALPIESPESDSIMGGGSPREHGDALS